jgi:hypothetical protein
MKADDQHNSILGKGRDSVRLVSNDEYGDGVYIFDINHMPVGCGTVSIPSNLTVYSPKLHSPSLDITTLLTL